MHGIAPKTKFGDLITADHKILNVENESRGGHKDPPVVQDDFSRVGSIQGYPMNTKENIGNHVAFTKISSSITEDRKNLHGYSAEFMKSLSRLTMES